MKNKFILAESIPALIILLLMCFSAYGGMALHPTLRIADNKEKIDLDQQIPKKFGAWQEDISVVPVLPNPELQSRLDALYSSTLSRTYINQSGKRVMLSIAYGNDQSSEATAVHRPEFCYSSQGFKVEAAGVHPITVDGKILNVQRLIGIQGQRIEPITYWITINDRATLPGIGRKLEQIKYGLKGQIPDGMLFRISSLGSDQIQNFKLQEQFLNDLAINMKPTIRQRYFGK